MTKKQAIKRAYQINTMLHNLQIKTHELLNNMEDEDMGYFPHMEQLMNTLRDLECFDLEDSVITADDYE